MNRPVLLAACAIIVAATGTTSAETIRMLSNEPSSAAGREFYKEVVAKYEAENPGTTIQIDYLDDTSLKTKLPTLLQSSARPDAFFSWAGGVYQEQIEAGILKDISPDMDASARAAFWPAGLEAYSYNGKLYGLPMYANGVVLFYNKAFLAKANVEPSSIKTWDDFLTAVKKIKDAGITPIVVGGKDKWPLMHFYGLIATRLVGAEGLAAADKGKDGGFNAPAFVRAGAELKRLADLKPFQPGFMDTTYTKSTGLFGDGKGAFILSFNSLSATQRRNSTSGEGIGDANLGFIPFPAIADGKGNPAETFGGIQGWAITKSAAPGTVKWMRYLLAKEAQSAAAGYGLWIPTVNGTEARLADPAYRGVAGLISKAPRHQLYLDQQLGAAVGAAINDATAEIVTGDITPEKAAARVEEARQMR